MIDIINILNNDGIAILPTDTIVGFSCKADSMIGCNRIKDLKKRDGKPFIILDSSLERVKSYFKADEEFSRFVDFLISEKIWPNNLTLIYAKNPNLKYHFLDKIPTIAVRLTDNPLIKNIAKQLNCGIISTSINLSGEEELKYFSPIYNLYNDKVDYIYPFKVGTKNIIPSTIIQFFSNKISGIKVLREGNQLICDKLKDYILS